MYTPVRCRAVPVPGLSSCGQEVHAKTSKITLTPALPCASLSENGRSVGLWSFEGKEPAESSPRWVSGGLLSNCVLVVCWEVSIDTFPLSVPVQDG